MSESPTISVEENSASAPGDLPLSEVRQRIALQGWQFRHDNHIRPLAPTPADDVTITAVSGSHIPVARAELWYTTDGRTPDETGHKLPMTKADVDWEASAGYLTRWQATIPVQPDGTNIRYRIAGWATDAAVGTPDHWAHDGHGFWFHVTDPEKGITTFAYRVEERAQKQPQWLYDAVIYQIFVDRFHLGTADGRFPAELDPQGKHGGTLKGIAQALPYLQELGVNCLWLSPVCVAETYHRYDAIDYFNVDSELGTNADLKALIDQAHALGMRMVLDFVPSHCSWKNPAFIKAQQEQDSAEASWFVFDEWPDKYRNFLNLVPYLPSFDTNSPGAREYLIKSALFWTEEMGFDGLRLDHTIGHGADFWTAFRTALQEANPEIVTIGEATDTADALRNYSGRIDDFLDFPLAHALRMTFGKQAWTLPALDSFLQAYEQYMAEGPERVSFLDNHDMNRFLFVADQDVAQLKLAAVCQFTLTATPTIYYGTEIGMSQEIDKEAAGFGGDALVREDMIWDETLWNRDLHQFYQQLIALRLAQPALRYGTRHTLHVDETIYAYTQQWQDDAVITAMNITGKPQMVDLPAGNHQLLLCTTAGASYANGQLTLPAKSAAILKRQ